MATLTLIRGLPGSGKSTYAKKHFNCLVLEQDMFFQKNGSYCYDSNRIQAAVEWCKQSASQALAIGMDVCVANTFVHKRFIEDYMNIAKKHGASFRVIRLDHDFGNIHNVPEAVLKSMRSRFEDWPNEDIA